jgi:predicted cupin superfamily sugar epimerase
MANSKKISAEEIKKLLDLQPLPIEGGYFRQTYIAGDEIAKDHLPKRYSENKAVSSAIYFLLTPDSFSALHKLPTDEIYHYYLGDPAELLELHPDGTSRKVILGADILNGQQVQHVAPQGVWQGSRLIPGGEWTLLGTTMAPAYTQADFELGEAAQLISEFPSEEKLIRKLTRTH